MVTVKSAAVLGIQAVPIDVEVDIRSGLPGFEIVGMAGLSVKESRERIRSALKNSGFTYPMHKIIVNLAPADLKKTGTLYDLPIAIGILAATGQLPLENLADYLVVGELSLNGELRAIPGLISIAELAQEQGKSLLIPAANSQEAAAACSRVYPVSSLSHAFSFLNNNINIPPIKQAAYVPSVPSGPMGIVKGQQIAKRMLAIAAAGHHHALLVGPPGTGKTLLARSVQSMMPPLSRAEAVEVTKIYSSAGLLPPNSGLITQRPVRMPHHNITKAGLLGGGTNIQPGEVSLASSGVLILDELLEFKSDVLQGLREPLEAKKITIVRANERVTYPTKFLLIATTNACPCGYLGDPYHECRCSHSEIRRYQKKLMGPLLDRIDLFTFLEPLKTEDYYNDHDPSETIPLKSCHPNGLLSDEEVQKIQLSAAVKNLLDKALQRLRLSGRGYYKTIKIAKTIAELDGMSEIQPYHVGEALRYRWEAMNLF